MLIASAEDGFDRRQIRVEGFELAAKIAHVGIDGALVAFEAGPEHQVHQLGSPAPSRPVSESARVPVSSPSAADALSAKAASLLPPQPSSSTRDRERTSRAYTGVG